MTCGGTPWCPCSSSAQRGEQQTGNTVHPQRAADKPATPEMRPWLEGGNKPFFSSSPLSLPLSLAPSLALLVRFDLGGGPPELEVVRASESEGELLVLRSCALDSGGCWAETNTPT